MKSLRPHPSNKHSKNIAAVTSSKSEPISENPLLFGNEDLYQTGPGRYLLVREDMYFHGKRVRRRSERWVLRAMNTPKFKKHFSWKTTRISMNEQQAIEWCLRDCIRGEIPATFQERACKAVQLMSGMSSELLSSLTQLSKKLNLTEDQIITQAVAGFVEEATTRRKAA